MISGTRKPPPISTSSPRETTTSRPRASAASTSSTAAALLLTTRAASAPQARASRVPACSWRDPLLPKPRRNSRLEYPEATSATAASAPAPSGARPRLVWTMTPVAFTTGWSSDRPRSAARRRASPRTASSATASPASTRRRASSTASRATVTARPWGKSPNAARTFVTEGSARRESTAASVGFQTMSPRLPRRRTFFKWLVIGLASIIVVPPAAAGVALATYLMMPLPASLPQERPQADSRVSTVYAVDGTPIGEFREAESRVVIPADQIPEVMKIAVIASEDQSFYEHSGVDWRGIFRAFWADVQNRSLKQGGSTITQQLAKNLYTDGSRTISRKAKEALIAAQVERVMSKEEILAKYLNTVYMGDSVFGVEAAALSYFKKHAKDLTLSEAALLAGVLPAPSLYSPRSNPGPAERRRLEVLGQIEQLGLRPPDEVAKARAETHKNQAGEVRPGPKVYPPPGVVGKYPYFLDYVRIYLLEVKKYDPDLVFRGGLRIETSLDPHLQEHAEKLLKKTLPAEKDPEAALVSIEPQTGFVRTLVGGTNWEDSKVNLALGQLGGGSGRQAGSAFKPFVLARAFEAGVSPNKVYPGPSCMTPRGFQKPVCNYEGGSFGSATLTRAMAASINTVFVQLIVDVGIKQTAEVAKRLGITSIDLDKPVYGGIAIGTQEVSPLDMSSAFGVFAARGLRAEPTPILKITQQDGTVLEDNTTEDRTTRVLEEPVADNINKVLTGVVEGGTGTAAKIGRPAAGKTGTSEEYQNAWFVGDRKSVV